MFRATRADMRHAAQVGAVIGMLVLFTVCAGLLLAPFGIDLDEGPAFLIMIVVFMVLCAVVATPHERRQALRATWEFLQGLALVALGLGILAAAGYGLVLWSRLDFT